ncbi:MAG: SDR family oxidoreductase [Deltaproteobacteria bacterium]|nr:MAG: SDR family oxidoreductase [Deltaproteobacteria bacterium]
MEKRGKDYFKGKSVIVSGAASGIGAEVAKQLAAEGARVALTDINQSGLETYRDAIKSKDANNDVDIFNIDIASRDSVIQGVEQVIQRFGGLDGLVNTAAILINIPFAEVPFETAEKVIDINLRGTMLMCRACLPHIMKKREGFIANTSSVSFFHGAPNKFLYDTTKAGIFTMSQGLKLEAEPYGISVSVCLPYIVDTPMTEDLSTLPPMAVKTIERMGKNSPGMVAHVMLEGIREQKFLLLPGREARYLWRIYRFSPGIIGWLTKSMSEVKKPSN